MSPCVIKVYKLNIEKIGRAVVACSLDRPGCASAFLSPINLRPAVACSLDRPGANVSLSKKKN
jgi:hypothetical protein